MPSTSHEVNFRICCRLLVLIEAGFIDRYQDIHFPFMAEHKGTQLGKGHATLENTTGAYVVLVAGICAASVVLLLEMAWTTLRSCTPAVIMESARAHSGFWLRGPVTTPNPNAPLK